MKTKTIRMLAAMLVMSAVWAQMTPSLRVSDQRAQGYTITVDQATLAEDGFVVVHAFDRDGELVLTPPLGLVYLPAGTHENVMIDLDPDLLIEYGYGTGEKDVLPMLHVDAEGNQTYEFPDGPDVPVMVDGEMVIATQGITFPAHLHVFDQTAIEGAVAIDTLTLAEDGFVVVHAFDRDGELVLTPPLGVTYLEAGIHRFVTVELDAALLEQYGYDEPKNILPMLHIDAEGNQAYEFPDGPDVPVMLDDDMVVATLELSQPATMMMEVTPSVDVSGEITLDVDGVGLSITIPSVTLAQPGFVVLHETDADGELVVLPVLAASDYLEAGTHENVTIRLPEDEVPMIGDRVFAMLHHDDGDMMYTFPESDPPVMMGDDIVMEPLTLE